MPAAEEHLKSEGLFDRVELKAGDYNGDQLPEDFDMVLLSNMKTFTNCGIFLSVLSKFNFSKLNLDF